MQHLTCVICVANDKTLSTLFVGRHFKLCEIAFYMKPWNRKATRASRQSLMTLMDLFLFDLFVPLFMVLNCRPIASMTYLSYIYMNLQNLSDIRDLQCTGTPAITCQASQKMENQLVTPALKDQVSPWGVGILEESLGMTADKNPCFEVSSLQYCRLPSDPLGMLGSHM